MLSLRWATRRCRCPPMECPSRRIAMVGFKRKKGYFILEKFSWIIGCRSLYSTKIIRNRHRYVFEQLSKFLGSHQKTPSSHSNKIKSYSSAPGRLCAVPGPARPSATCRRRGAAHFLRLKNWRDGFAKFSIKKAASFIFSCNALLFALLHADVTGDKVGYFLKIFSESF